VLHEVEQHGLGPVDVLEDDEDRPRACERLEQSPHRPEELLRRRAAAPLEHAEALDDKGSVGLVLHRVRNSLLAAETLDELGQRPERDPVAVGEAAARGHRRVRTHLGDELRDEPRLADSGRADHGDEPALAAIRACRELVAEHRELVTPADERRVPTAGERVGRSVGV
jgi:hypothetical protein